MMRVLVTGGCGFIGGHLCRRLRREGHEVMVLDDLSTGSRAVLPDGVTLIEGDVADKNACETAMIRAEAEACVHLAAIASVPVCQADWARATDVNLKGSVNIFAAAAARGIPVVYASSAAVYGTGGDTPITEDAPKRPLSNYGADKYASELHAAAAGQTAGLRSVGLRFFNVFGPGQDPKSPYSGVITIFARALAEGRAPTINGDGQQTRDFIHVSDVVAAIRAALDRASADAPVLNVCTGHKISLLTLYETLAQVIGSDIAPQFGPPRSGDIRHSCGNPRQAEAVLDFRAETGLAAGLDDLIRNG